MHVHVSSLYAYHKSRSVFWCVTLAAFGFSKPLGSFTSTTKEMYFHSPQSSLCSPPSLCLCQQCRDFLSQRWTDSDRGKQGKRQGEACKEITLIWVISLSELVRESTQDSLNACHAEIILPSPSKGYNTHFRVSAWSTTALPLGVPTDPKCVCIIGLMYERSRAELPWVFPTGTYHWVVLANVASRLAF